MKFAILCILSLVAVLLLFLGGMSNYLRDYAPAPKPVAISGAIIIVCVVWLAILP